MSRLRTLQTSFTSGEISPLMLGRGDLRAYANGAARLTNVFIHPTGGLARRDGLRFVDRLPGPARLIGFEFNTEQAYLLALTDRALRVYRDDALIASIATPWRGDQLAQLTWTQSADTLLVCHPAVEPQTVSRLADPDWRCQPWPLIRPDGTVRRPFYRFADAEVSLAMSGTSGAIEVAASAPVFMPDHVGARLRIAARQVRIDAYLHAARIAGTVLGTQPLPGIAPTGDWDEAAWSAARGFPVCATFHQDRLVVGGSRDLPNRLWMSRSGDMFDFDLGSGLDDQGIEFPILSDQVNAIRSVFSGRHLQVFTSGAEWMVTGEPLTPSTVQLRRQTRIGSPVDRAVPPRDVEGATLFAARNDREIREFLYTDSEQAYGTVDLALLARHLVDRPVDQDYDQNRRLLFVVMADGSVSALTAYRAEKVTAWTRLGTDGSVGAVAVSGGAVYLAVGRANGWSLERLSGETMLDAALTGSDETGKATWTGLDHLEGRTVRVVADDVDRGDHGILGGAVTLAGPARRVAIGLPYAHRIEPMPPFLAEMTGGSHGVAVRPVETVFRLHETGALTLDLGRGLADVPLRTIAGAAFDQPPPRFTGDRRVRHLGWTRNATRPLWRIEQDTPLPFCLLSVTTELKVND